MPRAPQPDPKAPTVITIGSFDGVHLGHVALIQRARAIAHAHGLRPRVVALVFEPHPMSTLAPGRVPGRLSTWDQRVERLRAVGADDVHRLAPDPTFLSQSAEAFVEHLCATRSPVAMVEGPDFRFGAQRAGDVRLLKSMGAQLGFEVDIVPQIEAALSDQTIVPVSSTMTRWLIERGRVEDAARLLGRPYELAGTVVQGDRRGRELGFPTANVETTCMLPGDGVYAGIARLPDGDQRAAAIHVGPRATFDSAPRTLEAHILDWTGLEPGSSEYGWPIRLSMTSFLRDQARFDGVEALIDQITRDVLRTRALVPAIHEIEVSP